MMKRKGLCTKRTIVGALVLTMGAVTTSTIAQEIGQVEDTNIQIDQQPFQTAFDCPLSFEDENGEWHLNQSANPWVDAQNSVACGAGGNTTENGWARCFDLNAEGIVGDFSISRVWFGVQQATIDGILINVNLYIDSDGCPPGALGDDVILLASASRTINMSDVGGGLKYVDFPEGTVAPAGSTLIIEIESPVDGTEEPLFAFRPRSNDIGQCGSSYLRSASCGIPGWIALEDIGFPDAHLVLKCIGTEEEPPGGPCGDADSGSCCEANGTPGCDDAACCETVCAADAFCCDNSWDSLCAGEALELCGDLCDDGDLCGDADSGSCCEANGTPGCDDAECCETVCAADVFCCDVSWDSSCAAGAADLCGDLCAPTGDTCDDCIPVGDGTIEGTTSDNNSEADISSCAFEDTVTEWYCYTASCDGTATVDTCGSGYDTTLAAYANCGGDEIACNDDACGLQSQISFAVVAGDIYYIRLSGFNGSSGSFVLTISCDPDGGGNSDCCINNGTPGCDDQACQDTVCAVDPFCCDVTWDQTCANQAADLCEVCGGGGGECPQSFLDGVIWTVNQSNDVVTDSGNTVACAGAGTTPQGWARCYDLVAEGILGDLTIDTVYFGVQQATADGIELSINLYIDLDGCPPTTPGGDAMLLASVPVTINMSDVGSDIAVTFPAGTIAPAGSTLIMEIEQVSDGNADPFFAFRPRSNDQGQCGPSYLRSVGCGLADWVDVADIGFPTAHLVLYCTGTEDGGAEPPCPWDLDGDNVIATSDLLILFSQWGLAGTADFDSSGAVGTADLLILFSNWGPCP